MVVKSEQSREEKRGREREREKIQIVFLILINLLIVMAFNMFNVIAACNMSSVLNNKYHDHHIYSQAFLLSVCWNIF